MELKNDTLKENMLDMENMEIDFGNIEEVLSPELPESVYDFMVNMPDKPY